MQDLATKTKITNWILSICLLAFGLLPILETIYFTILYNKTATLFWLFLFLFVLSSALLIYMIFHPIKEVKRIIFFLLVFGVLLSTTGMYVASLKLILLWYFWVFWNLSEKFAILIQEYEYSMSSIEYIKLDQVFNTQVYKYLQNGLSFLIISWFVSTIVMSVMIVEFGEGFAISLTLSLVIIFIIEFMLKSRDNIEINPISIKE